MDKFLELYILPRLNHEEKKKKKKNRPITSNDVESVIIKLPTSKSLRPDGFTGKSTKYLKKS